MKRIVCILLLILGIGYIGLQYNDLQQKYKNQTEEMTKLKTKNQKDAIAIKEVQPENSEVEGTKENKVVESFVYAYTNFDSIDARNKSIIDLVTKECQATNALSVKVHADFDSEGTIKAIYQKISDPFAYIVLGEEKSRGASHDFVMELHILNGKIDQYAYKYIEQN